MFTVAQLGTSKPALTEACARSVSLGCSSDLLGPVPGASRAAELLNFNFTKVLKWWHILWGRTEPRAGPALGCLRSQPLNDAFRADEGLVQKRQLGMKSALSWKNLDPVHP